MILYYFHINILQEKRAEEFIKLAEGEVENLRKEFSRWDNVPPADETTYELGMLKIKYFHYHNFSLKIF